MTPDPKSAPTMLSRHWSAGRTYLVYTSLFHRPCFLMNAAGLPALAAAVAPPERREWKV
jgi:hypothetical protein